MNSPRSSALAWLQAARPLALANIALPIVFGAALAYADQRAFAAGRLALALGFGLLDQLFIVFANDYADADADRQNHSFNLYSGGSRVIPDGKLSRHSVGRAALLMAALLLVLGASAGLLLQITAWFFLTPAALLLLWAYSYRPLRLSYRGGGEWLQALGLGVVLPLVGYSAQSTALGDMSWASLLPAFLLGYAGNISTALPDEPADASAGKHTYVVRAGGRRSRRDSLILIGAAALGTPLIAPHARYTASAGLVVVCLGLLLINLRNLDTAVAADRGACRWFVTLNGAAISLLFAGWSGLMWLGG